MSESIKSATLEVELARRQVLRNFKTIKKVIENFNVEANVSEGYTRQMAIDAFNCIDFEVEIQASQWLSGLEDKPEWENL